MTAGKDPAAIVTPSRTIGRSELASLATSIQSALFGSIHPGTPLGIWVEDVVDFAAGIVAGLASRAELFIIAPGSSARQARELCAMEGAAAVLCDRARATRLDGRSRHPASAGLVLVETQPTDRAVRHDAGAVHFYTSGTDGTPKGVARTKESLELEEATVGAHLGMRAGCTVLCAVPVNHGYGYTAGLFAPQSFGGTAVVARPRLAASLSRLLTVHRPEIVVAVPAQYAAWSALRQDHLGPLPRLWLCGGAPLPPAVRARFSAAWGGTIAEQYGMTECGAVSVDLDGAETLGRPYPGVTVSVDSAGEPAGVGELVVAAPYGPRGYLGDRVGQASARFTPGGFRTGDTGWLDAGGRLHLVGRRANQLNVRGQKVDPAEVERALWSLPGVHDAAVIGVDRPEGDQWIAAYVVGADDLTDEAMGRGMSVLETFKRPQRLIRVPAIPKTPTGKTDLEALRAMTRSGSTEG